MRTFLCKKNVENKKHKTKLFVHVYLGVSSLISDFVPCLDHINHDYFHTNKLPATIFKQNIVFVCVSFFFDIQRFRFHFPLFTITFPTTTITRISPGWLYFELAYTNWCDDASTYFQFIHSFK